MFIISYSYLGKYQGDYERLRKKCFSRDVISSRVTARQSIEIYKNQYLKLIADATATYI